MTQDLLLLLEQQKDLLYPETYTRIKENYDKMPEYLKEEISIQLQNASVLAKMAKEYESQRIFAVEEAVNHLKRIKNDAVKNYKEITAAIENEEKEGDSKVADEELNKL